MQTARKTDRKIEQSRPRVGPETAERLKLMFVLALMTPEQTAERLGVTVGTLAVWRATKRYPLRYIKVGSRVKYDPRDVESFEASRVKER